MGSTRALGTTGSATVTSAISLVDTPAGGASNVICAMRSSVTLSATGSMRCTLPGKARSGALRRRIEAGKPSAKPVARAWSKRVVTHRLPGCCSFSTAWPATTVEPGSASRAVTTPSAGASSRRLARWRPTASRSAPRRVTSCRAAARAASAAVSWASADFSACNLASTTLGLTKFWRCRSW